MVPGRGHLRRRADDGRRPGAARPLTGRDTGHRAHQTGAAGPRESTRPGGVPPRKAGLIRHLGLSNVRPDHLAEALAIAPVVCVQNPYGIGSPADDHAFLDACGRQGIAFVPFFAIAGAGKEAGVVAEEAGQVRAVGEAHGVSAAQVRLAWTLNRGPHVLAIPGTGNPDHLVENIAAGALRLTPEEVALLSALR
ncbi:aldo/keto reductase [Streptomyces flavotricini]|uniref:Aldo/keto reductase n=1 Tax=Streptomyces flavotricini TaxID=66888 RepID=A0ABS8DZE6_9ACTN|nr:aldo/keto reductase [Streptomyces flavotricini]